MQNFLDIKLWKRHPVGTLTMPKDEGKKIFKEGITSEFKSAEKGHQNILNRLLVLLRGSYFSEVSIRSWNIVACRLSYGRILLILSAMALDVAYCDCLLGALREVSVPVGDPVDLPVCVAV